MFHVTPALLCLIFRFLSLKEIASVGLVCKGWNWRYWRKTEQSQLWVSKIYCQITRDASETTMRLHQALSEMWLEEELSPNDPIDTIKRVGVKQLEIAEDHARGLWLSNRFFATFRPRFMIDPKIHVLSRRKYWVSGSSQKGALYYVGAHGSSPEDYSYSVSCMSGLWLKDDNSGAKSLISGSLISNGRLCYVGSWDHNLPHGYGTKYAENGDRDYIQYRGSFHMGTPHGKGVLYRRDGTTIYEGDWVRAEFHGAGTEFAEDGCTLQFQGRYEEGQRIEGKWYNGDGKLIHDGHYVGFNNLVEQCHLRHQCTFELTGTAHIDQLWYHCETCFPGDQHAGICLSCAGNCHKDHRLHKSKSDGKFFCDCNRVECRAQMGCDLDLDLCQCVSHEEENMSINVSVAGLEQFVLDHILGHHTIPLIANHIIGQPEVQIQIFPRYDDNDNDDDEDDSSDEGSEHP